MTRGTYPDGTTDPRQSGRPHVINARTDCYLGSIGDPSERFDAPCERLKRDIEAGAGCVFVPGVADPDLIRRFVETLQFPLNILVAPDTASRDLRFE